MKKEMNPKRKRRFFAALILCLTLCTIPALAADDPLTIVNNLSDFIFSCIKAVGVIILGWGIVQVGMSVQSHDASQRSQGFLCLLGGLLGGLPSLLAATLLGASVSQPGSPAFWLALGITAGVSVLSLLGYLLWQKRQKNKI